MLTSFQRKSRIIKYSSDLPCENVMRKYDALWTGVAYRAARPKKKVVLFPEIGRRKNFLSLTPLNSRKANKQNEIKKKKQEY